MSMNEMESKIRELRQLQALIDEVQQEEAGKRVMAKKKGLPLGTFSKQFSSEAQCQEHLASLRWQSGLFVPNAAAVMDISCLTDDISTPNATIRPR